MGNNRGSNEALTMGQKDPWLTSSRLLDGLFDAFIRNVDSNQNPFLCFPNFLLLAHGNKIHHCLAHCAQSKDTGMVEILGIWADGSLLALGDLDTGPEVHIAFEHIIANKFLLCTVSGAMGWNIRLAFLVHSSEVGAIPFCKFKPVVFGAACTHLERRSWRFLQGFGSLVAGSFRRIFSGQFPFGCCQLLTPSSFLLSLLLIPAVFLSRVCAVLCCLWRLQRIVARELDSKVDIIVVPVVGL